MVRSSQAWELGEPDLNDRGQPVVHNIAQKLGCIRPNSDIDLPVHSVFPEDESSMAELARQLEEQQPHDQEVSGAVSTTATRDGDSSAFNRADRASSSDLDHSDIEQDYRKMAFGGHNSLSLSPQSFASGSDFEFSTTPIDLDAGAMFSSQPSSMPDFSSSWTAVPKSQHQHQRSQQPQQSSNAMSMPFMQQPSSLQNLVMMNQNALDAEFGTIKPDILSYSNSDVMMGMGDPMIYASFDNESMRL